MSILDPIDDARTQLLKWLKEITRERLNFRASPLTDGQNSQSQVIVFWGPRFSSDLMKIELTNNQGTLSCQTLNANGLSLLPHTNRTKQFLREMKMNTSTGGKEHAASSR